MKYLFIAGNIPCRETKFGLLIFYLNIILILAIVFFLAYLVDSLIIRKKINSKFMVRILQAIGIIFLITLLLIKNNYSTC